MSSMLAQGFDADFDETRAESKGENFNEIPVNVLFRRTVCVIENERRSNVSDMYGNEVSSMVMQSFLDYVRNGSDHFRHVSAWLNLHAGSYRLDSVIRGYSRSKYILLAEQAKSVRERLREGAKKFFSSVGIVPEIAEAISEREEYRIDGNIVASVFRNILSKSPRHRPDAFANGVRVRPLGMKVLSEVCSDFDGPTRKKVSEEQWERLRAQVRKAIGASLLAAVALFGKPVHACVDTAQIENAVMVAVCCTERNPWANNAVLNKVTDRKDKDEREGEKGQIEYVFGR